MATGPFSPWIHPLASDKEPRGSEALLEWQESFYFAGHYWGSLPQARCLQTVFPRLDSKWKRTLNHESLASDQAETGLRSENEQPRLRLVHPDAYRMSFPMKITLWWPLRPTPRGVPRPRQAIFGAVSAPITMISQGYAPLEARILAWAAPSRLRRLCVAPLSPLGLGLTAGSAQAVEAPLLIWTACPKAGSDQFLDS